MDIKDIKTWGAIGSQLLIAIGGLFGFSKFQFGQINSNGLECT